MAGAPVKIDGHASMAVVETVSDRVRANGKQKKKGGVYVDNGKILIGVT